MHATRDNDVVRVREIAGKSINISAKQEFRGRVEGEPRNNILDGLDSRPHQTVVRQVTWKSMRNQPQTFLAFWRLQYRACRSNLSKSLVMFLMKNGRVIER